LCKTLRKIQPAKSQAMKYAARDQDVSPAKHIRDVARGDFEQHNKCREYGLQIKNLGEGKPP